MEGRRGGTGWDVARMTEIGSSSQRNDNDTDDDVLEVMKIYRNIAQQWKMIGLISAEP